MVSPAGGCTVSVDSPGAAELVITGPVVCTGLDVACDELVVLDVVLLVVLLVVDSFSELLPPHAASTGISAAVHAAEMTACALTR